jgi:hypothetical protein
MGFAVRAALSVWDFVVGDAWIVAGVVVATVIGSFVHASGSSSLEQMEGPAMFAAVLLGLILSLWQGARQSR